MAGRYRLDLKIAVGMLPAPAGREFVNQEREARIEKIGSVGKSQGVQMMTKPGRTQKGQRGLSGASQAVLESEEEWSHPTNMIQVKMREKKVGDFLPGKSQSGHGAKASNSAIQEEGGPRRFHPMGRRSSFGVRDQCAGPQNPNSQGQYTTLRTSTTPPARRRRR